MTKQKLQESIDTYGRDIYSFCRSLTREVSEAEELYQDTWLKVVERAEAVDMGGNIKSFCLSVALGLWKNRKRKFAWRRRIAQIHSMNAEDGEEAVEDSGPSPEALVLERERDERVREAVNRLPEKLKIVILLYYMEELPVARIAPVAGIPEGTVKSRLYQARKLLEKELEGV